MTNMNSRAYSKTHYVFKMWNFNHKMAIKNVFLCDSRIQTDGWIYILYANAHELVFSRST